MPAYTFRAAGTMAASSGSLGPGAPAGVAVGDLLLLATGCRAATGETFTAPAGWTALLDTTSTSNQSFFLLARIADGTGNDTPTPGDWWSLTSAGFAQVAAFYGDVYPTLASIIAHSAVQGGTNNDILNPALTISTANCLLVGLGKKSKTATSNGATVTSPAGLTNRIGFQFPTGSNVGFVWDYTQQTTATNLAASLWDQSINESLAYAAIVVALKTQAAVGGVTSRLGLLGVG